MILGADALLDLVARYAGELRVPMPVDRSFMCSIIAEAERLAGGRRADAPAALLYACARRARFFGKVGKAAFFDDVAIAQAASVGLTLDATELDLILLRGGIAFHAVGWEEVRDTFAAWLRPLGVPPKPSARKPAR